MVDAVHYLRCPLAPAGPAPAAEVMNCHHRTGRSQPPIAEMECPAPTATVGLDYDKTPRIRFYEYVAQELYFSEATAETTAEFVPVSGHGNSQRSCVEQHGRPSPCAAMIWESQGFDLDTNGAKPLLCIGPRRAFTQGTVLPAPAGTSRRKQTGGHEGACGSNQSAGVRPLNSTAVRI